MASELRVDKIVPVDGVPTGGGGVSGACYMMAQEIVN